MLQTGTKAPNFSLSDQNGQVHTLEEYKGKKVILYFYPKDNTPGCTTQACGFAELYPQFQEKGTVILGVSKDSVASHKKFEEKTIFPLRYCPTQIFLAYRHTMYGTRRKIMGRSAWGWCGQRT